MITSDIYGGGSLTNTFSKAHQYDRDVEMGRQAKDAAAAEQMGRMQIDMDRLGQYALEQKNRAEVLENYAMQPGLANKGIL